MAWSEYDEERERLGLLVAAVRSVRAAIWTLVGCFALRFVLPGILASFTRAEK